MFDDEIDDDHQNKKNKKIIRKKKHNIEVCDSVRAVLMGVESVQSLKTYENSSKN